MANLPDRKDGQRREDHGGQSGHIYLARSGHFNLAPAIVLRIMYIMLNYALRQLLRSTRVVGSHVATLSCCHPANIREPRCEP
jgi:hypothetical protein